ncbi:hypothetical protein ACX84Q_34685, partial [Burkholderia pseudomallei]
MRTNESAWAMVRVRLLIVRKRHARAARCGGRHEERYEDGTTSGAASDMAGGAVSGTASDMAGGAASGAASGMTGSAASGALRGFADGAG